MKAKFTLLQDKKRAVFVFKGGKGSGDFGHSGRPGMVGGSASDGENLSRSDALSILDDYAEWEPAGKSTVFRGGDIRDKGPTFLTTSPEMAIDYSQGKSLGVYKIPTGKLLIVNSSEWRHKLGSGKQKDLEDMAQDLYSDAPKWFLKFIRDEGYIGFASNDGGYIRIEHYGKKYIEPLETFTIKEFKQYKAVFAFKGGPGSGFEGHSGRPGLVGGSASEGTGNKPPLVDTTKDLVDAADEGAHSYVYFIMLDGKLLDCNSEDIQSDIIGNHEDIVSDNPEWFGLHPKEGEYASVSDVLAKDIIRVNYSKYEKDSVLNIETSKIDIPTLRRLQHLYDQNKLSYAKNIIWANNTISIECSIDIFLSAKYIVPSKYPSSMELKECIAIFHIKPINSKPIVGIP